MVRVVVVCCYESFSYLHFAAATSFCLVVRTSILKNRFNKLFQLVKKTFSAKESSPQKNSLEKKYLQMKKRHQTVSRNWLSQWKKTHKATFFYKCPGRFFTRRTNFIEPDQLRSDEKSGLRRCWSRPASSVSPTSFVFRFRQTRFSIKFVEPWKRWITVRSKLVSAKIFLFQFFAEIFHFFSEDENGTETETLGIKNKNLIRWSTRRRRR